MKKLLLAVFLGSCMLLTACSNQSGEQASTQPTTNTPVATATPESTIKSYTTGLPTNKAYAPVGINRQ